MESQLQNPEFRINPENFHPCNYFPLFLSKDVLSTHLLSETDHLSTHNISFDWK